ncbi:UDP-N-acetylmuramate dehydrogenase [Rarobacter faecitabidus]|uniref:UDP-N-acetylenolpyruvoylglucosamine reductase n=1 Tax=Rarobacter faecitabidus TaxID=13243 RepID=A0A542ZTT1_RARFA|nr:UDP-N-acetylmuramate dehydrogenase [Rarobacter faecitabidus]TQL63768.1 UDP-N-acetylmuramate dehydrogenase [Rarobacter faecitabidus]
MPAFDELTTLRVGGPADDYREVSTEAEFIETIRECDDAGVPLLVLGGGSNLVVSDEGFAGVVVRDVRSGVSPQSQDACGGVSFDVVAGHSWDALVLEAIENDWVGFEALSGIPGTVGAAPVQNIGAYGQEVAGAVANVRVWDRVAGAVRTFAASRLGFGYRSSMLKASMSAATELPGAPWYPSPAYVVLSVSFQVRLASLSAPIAYGELARTLGVEVGSRVPNSAVREAVLALRGGKGMLLDDPTRPDYDRWSAGSFFTNPIIPVELAADLPDGAPRYPVRSPLPQFTTGPSLGAVREDVVKTSAAWLIEHAGYPKGYGIAGEDSPARLSTKHTLAVTNRGSASASDVIALAREVRSGVQQRFGIRLEAEPVLVGVSLDE